MVYVKIISLPAMFIYIFFFKQNIHNTLHTGYCTGTHKGIFTEITKEIFYKGNV